MDNPVDKQLRCSSNDQILLLAGYKVAVDRELHCSGGVCLSVHSIHLEMVHWASEKWQHSGQDLLTSLWEPLFKEDSYTNMDSPGLPQKYTGVARGLQCGTILTWDLTYYYFMNSAVKNLHAKSNIAQKVVTLLRSIATNRYWNIGYIFRFCNWVLLNLIIPVKVLMSTAFTYCNVIHTYAASIYIFSCCAALWIHATDVKRSFHDTC